MSKLPPGWVELLSTAPRLRVRTRLGATEPNLTGGFGGWDLVARPRRTSSTDWQGREPFTLSLNLLLDGFKQGNSMEDEIRKIERMALPPRAATQPPAIKITGPVPRSDLAWVINEIQYGPAMYHRKGYRTRQDMTLILYQFVVADAVENLTPAEAAKYTTAPTGGFGGGKIAPSPTKTVTDGDTVSSIAATELGDASRWHEIADLNGIRDPKNITPGQVLLMP